MKKLQSIKRCPQFERLEARQLLAADVAVQLDNVDVEQPAVIGEYFGAPEEYEALRALDVQTAISVPSNLADQLRLPVEINGQTQTLVLERALSTRSSAFQVLLQQADGSLVEFDAGQENNYTGFVEELPDIHVTAVISSRGVTAEAFHDNGDFAWSIAPEDRRDATGNLVHSVSSFDAYALFTANHDHDGDGVADHGVGEHTNPETDGGHETGCCCEACTAAAASVVEANAVNATETSASAATVAAASVAAAATADPNASNVTVNNNSGTAAQVFNTAQVREAIIGFDVTNEAFRDGYNSDVQTVLDEIALFMITDEGVSPSTTSPNAVYLRDGLVHQVTGLIIIRTDQNSDPYADGDGNADTTQGLLNAFQTRWNANDDSAGDPQQDPNGTSHEDVSRSQSNHDLAHLLSGSDGTADGWGFVGTINEDFRYSIADATNDPVGWRGIARHEIGHNYGLRHFSETNRRAEFDPSPSNNGAGNGIGIFDPGGLRNGLTTDELVVVQNEVNTSGLALVNAGTPQAGTFTDHNVRPNALRDDVVAVGGNPLIIDVLANDFDANNDPLDIDRYNPLSEFGGTVSVVVGGGNDGQDVLLYTPPVGFSGVDNFFYYAGENPTFGGGAGLTTFGFVTIEVESPTTVDLTQTSYFYDFGTPDSPVEGGFTAITPNTFGDINFTGDVAGIDRGGSASPTSLVLANDNFELNSGVNFSQANNWDGSTQIAPHSGFGPGSSGTLGSWFAFNQGVNAPALQTLADTFTADMVYQFQSFVVNNSDDPDIVYSIGYLDGSSTFQQLATQTYDLDGINAWTQLDGVSYTAQSGGAEIGQQIVVRINSTIDQGVWFDEASVSIAEPVSNLNRDFVFSDNPVTFNHLIANGTYRVTLVVGDSNSPHDLVGVRAEGNLVSNNITTAAGEFAFVDENGASATPTSFDVTVNDGEINLEFFDNGGSDSNFVVNNLVIERSTTVDLNQTSYFYDFGTLDSPVEGGFTAITPNTFGDINFTGDVAGIDRGDSASPTSLVLANDDFELNSGVDFSQADNWDGSTRIAPHSGFGPGSSGTLGDWFAFNQGDRPAASQTLSDVFTADTVYQFQSFVVNNDDDPDIVYSIGYLDGSSTFQQLATQTYDLNGINAWTQLDGVSYTAQSGGAEIGQQIVVRINSTIDQGVWFDEASVTSAVALGDLNRDFVFSDNPVTFNHLIANGTYRVTLVVGDSNSPHDLVGVRAEGNLVSSNITTAAGEFAFVDENGTNATPTSFDVTVTDGELNLEFFDNGGSDPNFVVNHVSLDLINPADFNADGFVDALDLAQWQGDFGLNGNSDADGDDDSDGADFLAWQRNFGTSTNASLAPAALSQDHPQTISATIVEPTQLPSAEVVEVSLDSSRLGGLQSLSLTTSAPRHEQAVAVTPQVEQPAETRQQISKAVDPNTIDRFFTELELAHEQETREQDELEPLFQSFFTQKFL